MTDGFIDPPSKFAPISEWENYLRAIKKIKPRDDEIARLIDEAERMISGKTSK